MEIFLGIMLLVSGLCVGSFINMLEYRTAIKYKIKKKKVKSVNESRSFCDYCGRQLKWYENIPVISWVIQKGMTRCCGKLLPYQYPLVEILTGLVFLFLGYQVQSFKTFEIAVGMVVVTLLVFSTLFDLKYMILPDFSTYILAIIALVFFHNLISGLGSFLFLLMLHLITKGKGMGMGDVKLAVFMGLFLGWPYIIFAYYIAFISGSVVGILMMLFGGLRRKSLIPFGPFLIVGTVATYVFGNNLLYYINRWF